MLRARLLPGPGSQGPLKRRPCWVPRAYVKRSFSHCWGDRGPRKKNDLSSSRLSRTWACRDGQCHRASLEGGASCEETAVSHSELSALNEFYPLSQSNQQSSLPSPGPAHVGCELLMPCLEQQQCSARLDGSQQWSFSHRGPCSHSPRLLSTLHTETPLCSLCWAPLDLVPGAAEKQCFHYCPLSRQKQKGIPPMEISLHALCRL